MWPAAIRAAIIALTGGPEAAPSPGSHWNGPRMMSLTTPPNPASVAVQPGGSRQERHALTESALIRLAGCHNDRERRDLQEHVVLLNLRLADGIAARYAGRGVDWDDLVQVARLGLLKAVIGYRAGAGPDFEAFAKPTIAGEIKRYFRDQGWVIRPPRRVQELNGRLRLVEPDLQQRLRRAPSPVEVARELGIETRELSEAVVAGGGYTPLSLDVPTYADSGDSLGDALPDESDPYTAVETAAWLRPALSKLTDRERQILRRRFVDGLSQKQIGHQLGVSQMQVSRLLSSILARLRDELGVTYTPAAS